MNQYKEYTLEDFVLDARFQHWVRYQHQADVIFWQAYLRNNPSQVNDIMQAQLLLESVYRHYQTDISEAELDVEIHELLDKVRSTKNLNPLYENENTTPNHIINSRKWVLQVAAVITLAIGLGWFYKYQYNSKSDYEKLTSDKSLKEVSNETATNKILVLTDSSKVILHPHSKVSFPETFLPDKREVYLSGKASFQVSKDAKRPFLVYANELVTEVLGTHFTVNAPEEAQKTTVEVTEGKVSVFRQSDFSDSKNQKVLQSKGLVLVANQKVVFEKVSSNMLKTLRDSPEVVPSNESPKTFNFVNVPASTVLDDLKEAYQVDIIFDKELLNSCPVTASLSRQSLFEKLDIICEVIEAHYEMLDGKIVVYSKGCKN